MKTFVRSLSWEELQELMQAVRSRYASDFPDWEVVYMSVHKDPALRKQELAQIIHYLERELTGFTDLL